MNFDSYAHSRHDTTNPLSATDNSTNVEPIQARRVLSAKAAYATRRVDLTQVASLITGGATPNAGDLVLARVDKLGEHKRIELATGRRAPLFEGDEIVLCYGNRYAPDQFEGIVPEGLGPCNMVAAGGIAADAVAKHGSRKAATRITPVGLLSDTRGRRYNLSDWALNPLPAQADLPLTLVTVGTAMNAGKTTAAAYLIRGMTRAGLKIGAAKLTGTGAGGDTWLMRDAGAQLVLDFTDAGFASTYRVPLARLEYIFSVLTAHLQAAHVDAIVLEVADGLLQHETSGLLGTAIFRQAVDGIIFAAGDAMGAATGVNWLNDHDLPVFAVSGALTASPLAMREARAITGLPVLGLKDLSDPAIFEVVSRCIENTTGCRQAC